MKDLSHLATTAEIGRITVELRRLLGRVKCPQLKPNQTLQVESCIARIEIKQSCTENCKIAIAIKQFKTSTKYLDDRYEKF